MSFIVIPAVDIRGGRAVRLHQGRFDAETVFHDDPAAAAARWREAGAHRLHVVDLDGARDGERANAAAVAGIVEAMGDVPVELGGGIRAMADIEVVLAAGVRWAILGTAALERPELVREAVAAFPGRIIAGVDARDGRVSVRGWMEDSEVTAPELVARLAGEGVAAVIYTDVRRDGTGDGPNLEATAALARTGEVPVIASGGVGTLDHVRGAAALAGDGVIGVIVGRALYDGRFTLAEAMAAAAEAERC
jgi:phosphoribosylformimino-5-aminoimidazole carboxamide ribotide isomerase